MSEIDISQVDAIIDGCGTARSEAITILTGIQDCFHYLPQAALDRVGERTDCTPAQLYGVATFYSYFRMQPAGAHRVKVCIGTACHVKGAEAVYDAFRRYLALDEDSDTDADRLFTVEKVACLGCCMLAPAVQIGRTTYGHVTQAQVGGLLRDFLAAEAQRAKADGGEVLRGAASGGEVRLCRCTSCEAAGAGAVWEAAEAAIEALHLNVRLQLVGCTGLSFEAPLLEVVGEGGDAFRYGMVRADDVEATLLRHFQPAGLHRRVTTRALRWLDRCVDSFEEHEAPFRYAADIRETIASPYWQRQDHIVLDGAGEMGPLDLAAYRARGGFEALQRCRERYTPDEVIELIVASGLRGRGGGGFPAGLKWRQTASAAEGMRYLVCNGDEGDPGSFMDRMILESFPFRVIEGMAIAAYAVGAGEGIFYVRCEYPLAVKRVREAIQMCVDAGLLGEGLALRVAEGAGAFVCGEETALLAAIEGQRGMPRIRPPYPSEQGLHGRPTLVNNVETLATVPWIVVKGVESFRALGTPGSPGTKTLALAGRIVKGGLIEVPMGTTIRDVVEEIGGGVEEGHSFKAVQIGGPSGGCIPARLADIPIDFDSLHSEGSMMGSGGLVVLDDSDCMVEIARYFLAFSQDESCGKCTFCRVGTRRMLDILERLCAGEGRSGDIEDLEKLAGWVQAGSLCGLGKTAPNPVLSTLQHFREEYEAHVAGQCPAGRCKALIRYAITTDCIGCTRCAQHCPVDAIPFTPHERHVIDDAACIRCDTCKQVCPANAVIIRPKKAGA